MSVRKLTHRDRDSVKGSQMRWGTSELQIRFAFLLQSRLIPLAERLAFSESQGSTRFGKIWRRPRYLLGALLHHQGLVAAAKAKYLLMNGECFAWYTSS